MDSPVMNYMETNPWSLTNSNALAIILMESTFLKLLAYRFSTSHHLLFILTLIFYSLFNCLILLIQLMRFYFCSSIFALQFLFFYSILFHKHGLSAVKDSRLDQKTLLYII